MIAPYIQLHGRKDSGKNNEHSTAVILNVDTDFMFFFLNLKSTRKLSSWHSYPQNFYQ